jgi:Sulfotransferase domain
VLPTFVGIGVPRAGTTWLHELLAAHPAVCMAQGRKEVHFFDDNFERGVDWYRRFFPERVPPAVAVGEITPHYLYEPRCIDRIDRTLPEAGLLVSLRNPVDRLVSHFRHRARVDGFTGSLHDFVREHPHAVSWGRYDAHLAPWLERFPPDRICLLVFEDAVTDVGATLQRLAELTGVPVSGFPEGAGAGAVNQSALPRRRRAYALATRQARRLRARDADWAVNVAKRLGLGRIAGGRSVEPGPSITEVERRELWDLFADDVARLEELTGRSFAAWRPSRRAEEDAE